MKQRLIKHSQESLEFIFKLSTLSSEEGTGGLTEPRQFNDEALRGLYALTRVAAG